MAEEWNHSGVTYDDQAIQAVWISQNMLVPWYLMASFAYYHRNCNLLSDDVFDAFCRRIDDVHPQLVHRHAHLIPLPSRSNAHALLEAAYPRIVRDTARMLAEGAPCQK